MKVDMFFIWLCAFAGPLVIQNYFTVTKTAWDVSYQWTTESMEIWQQRQKAVRCDGTDLPWMTLKHWLEENEKIEGTENEKVQVVVLATNKGETTRYWKPFWCHQ